MKVLITGQAGYVGAVMGPHLAAAGHDVVGLDTLYYRNCDLFPLEATVPLVQRDVRDVTPEDLDGFDAVVHLAALSNDPMGAVDSELTLEINVGGTLTVARAAQAAGVRRFVFASSCSMYGASGPDGRVDESAPLMPLSAYAESKVRAEEGLSQLSAGGLEPVFMRFATAHGVSPRLRLDIVLNNLVAWALTTGEIRILSDGTPWRPIVHVQDMAEAVRQVLEADSDVVSGEAFNVGADSENYQVTELADFVAEAVPGCTIEYAGTGDPDPRSYRVDFGKFSRAFPAFRTAWDARSSAADLARAYEAAGLTLETFEGDRYIRLRRLQQLRAGGHLDDALRWARSAEAVAEPAG